MEHLKARTRYWKTNLLVIFSLLAVWGTASCLCGIVFIEQLNTLSIGKLPFGFWMANQGSMLIFVVLILIYAVTMDTLDRRYLRDVSVKGPDVDN